MEMGLSDGRMGQGGGAWGQGGKGRAKGGGREGGRAKGGGRKGGRGEKWKMAGNLNKGTYRQNGGKFETSSTKNCLVGGCVRLVH